MLVNVVSMIITSSLLMRLIFQISQAVVKDSRDLLAWGSLQPSFVSMSIWKPIQVSGQGTSTADKLNQRDKLILKVRSRLGIPFLSLLWTSPHPKPVIGFVKSLD